MLYNQPALSCTGQSIVENRTHLFFKIDGYALADMPMKRLAGYMSRLAELLGSEKHVHVESLTSGSVVLACAIDSRNREEALQRVLDASQENAIPQANNAYQRINKLLAADESKGHLLDANRAEIIPFPGCEHFTQETFSPFKQEASFDARVIRVGGKSDPVPVWLQSGNEQASCLASRDMAKKLAIHLFDTELRIFGEGLRFQDMDGNWKFKRFTITGFEKLDNTPLTTLVAQLRDIPGNGWEKLKNPWETLEQEREACRTHLNQTTDEAESFQP